MPNPDSSQRGGRWWWVALAGLVLVGCIAAPAASTRVEIETSLPPRMTPAEIVAMVEERVRSMGALVGRSDPARIERVVATTSGKLGAIDPDAPLDNATPAGTILWYVRARGPFVTQRGPDPGAMVFDRGYFVIDDASGQIVGAGMGP